MSGGRIDAVRYNSIAPLAERLKALQIPLGENSDTSGFLNALRGTRVEVRSGTAGASGRVLSVERVTKESNTGGRIESAQLAIVTDAGELRTFDLNTGTVVRIADDDIRQEVGRYMSLVGSTRARDIRKMSFSTTGTGERDLIVSYISEVPVWKSTYRIVVPKAPGTPFLQGWAVVDNTVGEDWSNVQLSLVSGAPQSFVQDISQPYYVRRPVIPLPQSAVTVPQEHDSALEGGISGGIVGKVRSIGSGTLTGAVTDQAGSALPGATVTAVNQASGAPLTATTNAAGLFNFTNLEPGNTELRVALTGFKPYVQRMYVGPGRSNPVHVTLSVGGVSETVMVQAEPTFNTSANTLLMSALRKQTAEAEGQKLGDYFQYTLKQKITVHKNQSALVPIVQAPIETEKVTLVTATDESEIEERPMRALWLRNNSGLTLDGETFNVLEDDSFAGEGLIDVLHPNERRLLTYAADTAVEAKLENESQEMPVTRVSIAKGVLKMTRERRRASTYTIHNADSAPRTVVIEHPIEGDWKLNDIVKPEETSARHYRFRVKVDAGKTEKLRVEAFQPTEITYQLTNLNDQLLALFVQGKMISASLEDALRKIVAKKMELDGVNRQLAERQKELDAIDKDQARVRENMKALKGTAEEKTLLLRYTRQLDSQEDRVATLKNEIADLQQKRAQLSGERDDMVLKITLDEKP